MNDPGRMKPMAPLFFRSGFRLWEMFVAAGILLVLVLAAHGRTAGYGFIPLDDNFYIYQNPHVISGLTAESAAWAMRGSEVAYWHPVTWLYHMAEAGLTGPRPWAMHISSLLLHFVNAVLFFVLLAVWTREPKKSLLAAALFAVHPVNVESVAWLSQKKTLLSGTFALAAFLAWASWARRGRAVAWAASLIFLALGLMSKPVLTVFPLALVLADFWPLDRAGRVPVQRLALEKAAPLALCLLGAGAALWTNAGFGMSVTGEVSFLARLARVPWVVFQHLAHVAWPVDLCVFYPYPGRLSPAVLAGAALAVAGITGAAVLARRSRPWLLFGWVWFLVFLLPVLGLVQTGAWPGSADRFLYLPAMGLFVALAWEGSQWFSRRTARFSVTSAGLLVAMLTVLCFFQAGLWKDGVSLFGHAMETSPSATSAAALASAFKIRGDGDEAAAAYERAVEMAPDYAPALKSGADALADVGRLEQALEWHARSLGRTPAEARDRAAAWMEAIREAGPRAMGIRNLGDLFLAAGLEDQALVYFEQANRFHPFNPHAANNLGMILARRGFLDRAEPLFRMAAGLLPGQFYPAYNLGSLYLTRGLHARAVPWLEKAVGVDPENPVAQRALGLALAGAGRAGEAGDHLAEAVRLAPEDTEALLALGRVQLETGKAPEAVEVFGRAARLLPLDPETRTLLARALEKEGWLSQAANQYAWVLERFPEDSRTHVSLGRVLERMGKPGPARAHFEAALALDPGCAEAREGLAGLDFQDAAATPAALVRQGLARMDQGDWAGAEALFLQALDRDPALVAAAYNLACLESLRGQEDEAVRWLKKAVDLGFSDWGLLAGDLDLANIRDNSYWIELESSHPDAFRKNPVPSEPRKAENEED
ncbi:MAG: tetratricopeptide repeat protein [Proteobacteria bacterium]|nr:tetratricopeptide repeat protein [Pseudomonadota bacterium]